MDWHDLHKMKVTELREMAKEKLEMQGVSGLNKEQLVEALASAMGIPKPHKVVESATKGTIKAKIRELKAKRVEAARKGDKKSKEFLRKQIHRLKRKLHAMAHVTE
jgi:N-acetylglucosamine kinase-like BadF-type ATPase